MSKNIRIRVNSVWIVYPFPPDLPLPACQVHGKTYVDGESWEPDLCTFCVCYNGGTLCGGHMCDSTNHCPDAFVPEGECCAVCPSSGERHGPKGQSGQMVPAMAIVSSLISLFRTLTAFKSHFIVNFFTCAKHNVYAQWRFKYVPCACRHVKTPEVQRHNIVAVTSISLTPVRAEPSLFMLISAFLSCSLYLQFV